MQSSTRLMCITLAISLVWLTGCLEDSPDVADRTCPLGEVCLAEDNVSGLETTNATAEVATECVERPIKLTTCPPESVPLEQNPENPA